MNLSWIFSILSKSTFLRGFHTGEMYSSIGLTYVQNVVLRISWFLEAKAERISLDILATFLMILSMCLSSYGERNR